MARINAEFQALYKVWQLASDLASQIKLTQPNQPANTDASPDDLPPEAGSSYSATLARWILFNARQQTDLHVFVIEGAFAQDIDPDIPLFVNALAQQICLPTQRQQTRLILIDAIGELVGVQDADWVEETLTDAADLIPDDLVPCIERLNQIRAEKGLAQMPELPLVMAKAIIREAPAAGKARLAHLHNRLRGLLPPRYRSPSPANPTARPAARWSSCIKTPSARSAPNPMCRPHTAGPRPCWPPSAMYPH